MSDSSKQTVLVTAIGSFSADAVISNLHAAGMRVVGCDIYPRELLATSLEVEAFYQAPLARDVEEYVSFLQSVIREQSAVYLFPLTDIEVDVLNEHRAQMEELGCRVCMSAREVIALCRDKHAFAEFVNASSIDVRTIDTSIVADIDEPASLPVVVKPANGRSSEGLSIVRTPHDWKWVKEDAARSDFLVQPFVEGRIVTVDVVCQPDAGTCVAIPREELLRTPNGAGTSVHVFEDEALARTCRELALALGIRGCVNFEFIRDAQGAYWLLECNPRFSGGVKFSCMTGYDCVLNHLRCFEGKAIDELEPYRARYIARKYEEFVTQVG